MLQFFFFFFIDLEVKMQQAGDYIAIIGGDFNLVMDPILDRSSTTSVKMWKALLIVKHMAESMGYIDVWMCEHLNIRSCLSQPACCPL